MEEMMDYTTKEQNLYNEVWQLMNGNQASYNNVYEFSVDYVFGLICELLDAENGRAAQGQIDAQQAVDAIINQVYSYIYYNIKDMQSPQDFYSWVGQITTTETVNYLMQMGHFTVAQSNGNGAEVADYCSQDGEAIVAGDMFVNAEKHRRLTEYVASLDVYARAVVQYYYYEGVSVGYIAQVLGCSVDDVKKQISAIRENIAIISGNGLDGTLMYGMSSLPVLWLMFKSGFSGVPAAQLAGKLTVGGEAASRASDSLPQGADVGGAAGNASGANMSNGGARAAGNASGANMSNGGTRTAGNASGRNATNGGARTAGNASGRNAANGGARTAGANVSTAGRTSSGKSAGMSTGIKVAIAAAAVLLVGGGAAAIFHNVSKDKAAKSDTSTESMSDGLETSAEQGEEPTESSTELSTEAASQEANTTDLAAASTAAYQSFMSGELTAVVDDMYVNVAFESTVDLGFTQGEAVSVSDIENRFGLCVGGSSENTYEITDRSYGYLDAGNDGVQELAINLSGTLDETETGNLTVVLKYKEDGLHLTYAGYSLYRVGTTVYSGGQVSYYGSGGASSNYTEGGVLDANGVYHNLYTMNFEGDPVNGVTEDAFKSAAETMQSEFEDYFPGVAIKTYSIDGATYYVAEDEEGYAGTEQNTRYHELLETTTGITFTSADDIANMINAEQEKYVTGVAYDDTTAINWTNY
jgi:DNA-directed RNA polymerase specialized sigma24 family protein